MRPRLVNVWELKVSLSVAITDRSMVELRECVRSIADREAAASVVLSPFLWNTRGALLTVQSQGEPFALIEIAEWALMNCSPGPGGFELHSKRTAPLRKTEGWQGYGTD